MPHLNLLDFGAAGDGQTDNTEAIQTAIDQAASQGGGTVAFPAGNFVSGTVYQKSRTGIHLEAGATWSGSADPARYPMVPPAIRSRMDTTPWRALVYAHDQEDLSLSGPGTFHPNGEADCFQTKRGDDPERAYGIHFVGCRDIVVRDWTMRNSAFWMQRYFTCQRLRLHGLKIWNHCNLNNDGVDIDGCQDVFVSDCLIDSSDDALTFKSEGSALCENVVVTNCILASHASAFKLGTASIGGFKKFSASNCVIRPSQSPEMFHQLEAWGGLVGIDLGNVDGGIMEDIQFDNFSIDGPESPIFIWLGERNSRCGGKLLPEWTEGPRPAEGRTRHIRLANIMARNSGPIASSISGFEGHPVEDIHLANISIEPTRPPKQKVEESVSKNTRAYPINRAWRSDLPAYGLYLSHAKRVTLENLRFTAPDDDPRPAAWLEDIEALRARAISAEGPHAQIRRHNCRYWE